MDKNRILEIGKSTFEELLRIGPESELSLSMVLGEKKYIFNGLDVFFEYPGNIAYVKRSWNGYDIPKVRCWKKRFERHIKSDDYAFNPEILKELE